MMRSTARAPSVSPLGLALALSLAGGAFPASASLPAPTAPMASAVDETGLFRAIRAEEAAGDADRLGAWTAAEQPPRVRARAALALEAARLRASARTVADAIAAERRIESLRGALLAKIESDAPLAARELALESAEDLLLRLHAIPLADVTISIGLPGAAELADAHALLAAVEARLASAVVAPALGGAADIATDPAVFRAHALKALACVLAADLAQCDADGLTDADPSASARAAARARADAARVEAQRLFARAGLCELPIPAALGDILALARGRVEKDDAARDRLLARAADSADPATALVARVTRWRDAGGRGGFPTVGVESAPLEPLARIAFAAEMRARRGLGANADAVAAPLARCLQRAGAESRDPSASIKRRRATADWFAERLPREVRSMAERNDAPLALVAVAALGPDGARVLDAAPDASARAADDPLLGPILALRVAEWRASRGETAAAADAILAAIRAFEGLPAAREAVDIALDIRRANARDAGRAAATSRSLDEALALAIERFGADPAAFGWRCERIDLALFGPGEVRDLGRAASLLRSATTRDLPDSDRNNLFLRQIELELARLTDGLSWQAAAAREELAAQLVELGKTAMVFDVQALPAIDPQTTPLYIRTLPARMSAVRAAIALVTGDALRARILSERANADPFVDDETALRAARTWIDAALASGEPMHLPPELRALAARSAPLREWTAQPLARLVDAAEAALSEGTQPKDPPGSIDALASIVSAETARPNATGLRAKALGRLAALDRVQAAELARAALAADATDRLSLWVLAESLRGEPDAEARGEAFELYRRLSPLSAAERDRFWWRGQLAQVEMVAARDADPADIVGRINRIAALDPSFGGPTLAKRFEALRSQALAATRASGRATERGPDTTD